MEARRARAGVEALLRAEEGTVVAAAATRAGEFLLAFELCKARGAHGVGGVRGRDEEGGGVDEHDLSGGEVDGGDEAAAGGAAVGDGDGGRQHCHCLSRFVPFRIRFVFNALCFERIENEAEKLYVRFQIQINAERRQEKRLKKRTVF